MKTLNKIAISSLVVLILCTLNVQGQVSFYRTNGGEVIFSGSNIEFNNEMVNSNMRFTMFFHSQQQLNLDLTSFLGLYTGYGIRNIGYITEDLYQNVGFLNIDDTHADWNKNVKIKRRSYSLGFPIAIKLGNLKKDIFLYAGGEYEWMFHYKQKLFIDGNKFKFTEWASKRVNPWMPSFFAGIQLPKGMNLKVKYYMDNFLNPNFSGIDFGENVDYSNYQSSGIWYISFSTIINKKKLESIIGDQIGKEL